MLRNPRLLFWVALVLIVINCSMLTVTEALFGGNPTPLSIFMDFIPVFSYLFAVWFFKTLATSMIPPADFHTSIPTTPSRPKPPSICRYRN